MHLPALQIWGRSWQQNAIFPSRSGLQLNNANWTIALENSSLCWILHRGKILVLPQFCCFWFGNYKTHQKKKLMEKMVVLHEASFYLICLFFLAFVERVFGCFGFGSQHEQKRTFWVHDPQTKIWGKRIHVEKRTFFSMGAFVFWLTPEKRKVLSRKPNKNQQNLWQNQKSQVKPSFLFQNTFFLVLQGLHSDTFSI